MISAQARFPALRRAPAPRAARRAGPVRVRAFQETSAPPTVPITFSVPFEVAFGQSLRLVGSDEAMGGWEIDSAVDMTWSEGHVWTADVALPVGATAEFKLVLSIPGEAPVWEHTANRTITVPEGAGALALDLGSWCDPVTAAEPVATAAPAETEGAVADDDLLTPPFQAAVDSVKTFFSGGAAEAEAEEEALAAEAAVAEMEIAAVEEEEEAEVAEAEEAVLATEAVVVEAEAAPATTDMLKSAAKTAGALALGVAGAALLSALAIDVTETAVVGALAVAAGGAALQGATPSAAKASKAAGEDEEEEEGADAELVPEAEGDERRIKGAGETGVIIAAGILSALDAGKKAAEMLGAKSSDE